MEERDGGCGRDRAIDTSVFLECLRVRSLEVELHDARVCQYNAGTLRTALRTHLSTFAFGGGSRVALA